LINVKPKAGQSSWRFHLILLSVALLVYLAWYTGKCVAAATVLEEENICRI